MYLLDTNICSAIIAKNQTILTQFYSNYAQCYLSTIIIAELYKGVYCSQRIEENLRYINEFLSLILTIVEFDQKAATEFGKIQGELRKMGKPTGELDALIAGVARSRGDVIVTNNTRHFIEIPNLKLNNWFQM